MMQHARTTGECEERFKAIDGQLDALRALAQGTAATVMGNGKPGLVTAQALVAQQLEAVEGRLARVEGRLETMADAPREVRDEMAAGFGRVEDALAQIAATQAQPTKSAPPASSSGFDLSPSLVKALLAVISILGAAIVIIAAVLGVDIGGTP